MPSAERKTKLFNCGLQEIPRGGQAGGGSVKGEVEIKTLVLTGQSARQAAIQAIAHAPDGMVFKLLEPTRNLEQNAKLHVELGEISGRLRWAGEFLSIEEWKRLLTAAWMRATNRKMKILPSVDGHGYDLLYLRTSTLGKSEMNELIEYVCAWKADRPEFFKEPV